MQQLATDILTVVARRFGVSRRACRRLPSAARARRRGRPHASPAPARRRADRVARGRPRTGARRGAGDRRDRRCPARADGGARALRGRRRGRQLHGRDRRDRGGGGCARARPRRAGRAWQGTGASLGDGSAARRGRAARRVRGRRRRHGGGSGLPRVAARRVRGRRRRRTGRVAARARRVEPIAAARGRVPARQPGTAVGTPSPPPAEHAAGQRHAARAQHARGASVGRVHEHGGPRVLHRAPPRGCADRVRPRCDRSLSDGAERARGRAPERALGGGEGARRTRR